MARIKFEDLEEVTATKAKINLGGLLHETAVNGRQFVVNRQGKPVSVILSYNDYRDLLAELERLRRIRGPDTLPSLR
ncbi:MAG: type II toxin-antitoxin system Phd/YefM family antitoxin [Kiritimatiellaeota bacterium]|nr:type II toxin-antitoxin system Phd/YefM family antitoxin [Kiritimatiellota bacterium]